MSSLRNFKPAFYLVIALGITGFSMAIESMGLWLLMGAAMGLHLWLVRTDRFRPLPRLAANLMTLAALGYTFYAVRTSATPIITIGQFLCLLQVVKLFELRANRDYAQLLVLSLLLMIAAAISTARLVFAVLLLFYLFMALYCCLLFHLKFEHDRAVAAQTLPPEKLNAATVRQDQRFLPRSMKKLATLVTMIGLVMAVLVFLFFPRGTGAGMFAQFQLRPGQALTGFSDQVSLSQITQIAQNTEIVANVQIVKNNRLVEGTEPLYLRGRTVDRYSLLLRRWDRTPSVLARDIALAAEEPVQLPPRALMPLSGDTYLQKISLRPTGSNTLFMLPGALSFTALRDVGRVRYHADDQTLQVAERLYHRLDYEVISRVSEVSPMAPRRGPQPEVPPRVAEYARRPEVCGADDQGRALATVRDPAANTTDLDDAIAANIEKHLRGAFTYTLDLPSEAAIDPAQDPVEQFLYDWKKGHCELFASAMTLMLQSLGIDARMVTGFRCDEYDATMGHYYIVRQSHAHAWVEVRTPAGWRHFDPTSGQAGDGARNRNAWQAVKHFFAFLEYKWATNVIAYDGDRRDNLVGRVERGVVGAVVNNDISPRRAWRGVTNWWSDFTDRIDRWLNSGGWLISADILIGLIFALLALLLIAVAGFFWQRWRMRRRAIRIGLEGLPSAEQLRLARQLGFYERLVTLLEKYRIIRPLYLTAAEFAGSLVFLPSDAYEDVLRLTGAFYEVRFGRRNLDPDQQRSLDQTVDRLEPILGSTALSA